MNRERALQALRELGSTPEAVESKLRSLKIRGARSSSRLCPVARYVSEKLGQDVMVSRWSCYTKDDFDGIQIPAAVQHFIEDFDNRRIGRDLEIEAVQP